MSDAGWRLDGTELWRLPVGIATFSGLDMTAPLPIRYTQMRPRRVERPAGFALWGARRGWAQVGSREDREWTAWAGHYERTFGVRANLRAAAAYIRRRYGLGSGAESWHVHASDRYRSYVVGRRGSERLARMVRLRLVVAAIDEIGRGAEEVQWTWAR